MLLIIHNLPPNTRYSDVKALIKEKCGLTELIVDNLLAEGKAKKVTVGLAEECDAAILVRKINGLFYFNHQLHVEDVRQSKANEQPYWPTSTQTNQYEQQDQYNGQQMFHEPDSVGNDQYYMEADGVQYEGPPQPEPRMESRPNFGGLPFYMTAQNQNVGNNQQYMVQYPKLHGHMGNESNEGRDVGFDQQYGREKAGRCRSPDSGRRMEHSSRSLSRWNEPRPENRRDRDRSKEYDNRYNSEQFYREKPYKDSHRRTTQVYGSNKRSRSEKYSNQPEPKLDRSYLSTFGEAKKPFDRRYDQQKDDSQRFMEDFSPSRDSNYLPRTSDFPKKRPFESPNSETFGSKNKKVCYKQQYNTRNEPRPSGTSFSNDFQNKKNMYFNKSPVNSPATEQAKPYMQPRGFQKFDNKPQWQQPKPGLSTNQPMDKRNQAKFPAKPKPLPGQKMINYETPRFLAASIIITQIIKNIGVVQVKRSPMANKLKECVRARIDVVAGDNFGLTVRNLISMYRKRFQDDVEFYNAVLDKVNGSNVQNDDAEDKETVQVIQEKKKSDIIPRPHPVQKPPVNVAPVHQVPVPIKLPNYPKGDKKMKNEMKMAQKLEAIDESMYTMDVAREKALCEELDIFEEIVKKEIENPQDDVEKSACKFVTDAFIPDMRKLLTLNVRKRVLNIKTNLVVRVNCQPKAPKRPVLEAFLKNYGVISLKVSDRNRNTMIAVCNSFKNYDALCQLAVTAIDTFRVTFKPLHLTGPPVKGSFKKMLANATKSKNYISGNEIEASKTENYVEEGPDVTEENINQGDTHFEEMAKSNDVSECEIINNEKNEVIVIEDNTHKTKDVILDQNEDKKKTDTEENIDLNGAVTNSINEAVIDSESISTCNENGDEEKTTFKNDVITMAPEDLEVIDNDNIEEDDLEDF